MVTENKRFPSIHLVILRRGDKIRKLIVTAECETDITETPLRKFTGWYLDKTAELKHPLCFRIYSNNVGVE